MKALNQMCLYAFMRTTVMLPPDVMRAAKARTAERGESLKTLLTRAVEAELGRATSPEPAGARVALPLFGSADASPVRVSNADLARALAEADAAAVPTRRLATAARTSKRSGR
jgi:hypothetical protein